MGSNESLGQRLRACRAGLGLSGAAVEEELGITRGNLYRLERDEVDPSTDVLLTLARFYGVTTDYLLSGVA